MARQALMILLTVSLVGLTLFGCGSQVARETGTIEGSLPWSGTWPEEGAMLVVLFDEPPWSEAFVPGPPAAFTILEKPAPGDPAGFAIAPGVPFGTYGALAAAWQDPSAGAQPEHMRPVAVWGTRLDQLDAATPVDLTRQSPDLKVSFDPIELFGPAADMRVHYPPVEY